MARPRRCVALVAHDNKKAELVEWVKQHRDMLSNYDLCATGTTGTLVEEELGLSVRKFESGPLGGDQQIGARIAEGEIDFLIFFWTHWCVAADCGGLEYSICVQSHFG
jgi:methylglyoxal synthase